MISRTGMHAIKALVYLAQRPRGEFQGTSEIARSIGATRNYLGKLLQALSRERNLVSSQKGKGGGFRLEGDPRRIRLIQVLEPVDHVSRWSQCLLDGGRCSESNPCGVHERWRKARTPFIKFLEETTVADLAREPDLLKRRG